MSNEDNQEQLPDQERAIELDEETANDLDQAMRDALEAIEQNVPESGEGEVASDAGGADLGPIAAVEFEAVKREATEQREKALRTLADFENFRKRVQREREDERKFRAFEPMRTVLDVVDNLNRAAESSGSIEDLKQGVEMILRQMDGLLRENGVESVLADGQPFDPSVHEAVSKDEDPSIAVPTVSEVLQQGYTMHGRLLRPAVVRVMMPTSSGVSIGNVDDN